MKLEDVVIKELYEEKKISQPSEMIKVKSFTEQHTNKWSWSFLSFWCVCVCVYGDHELHECCWFIKLCPWQIGYITFLLVYEYLNNQKSWLKERKLWERLLQIFKFWKKCLKTQAEETGAIRLIMNNNFELQSWWDAPCTIKWQAKGVKGGNFEKKEVFFATTSTHTKMKKDKKINELQMEEQVIIVVCKKPEKTNQAYFWIKNSSINEEEEEDFR